MTTNTLKMTTRLGNAMNYMADKTIDAYLKFTRGYIDDEPLTPDPIQASLDHICDKTRAFLGNRKNKGENKGKKK